MIILNDFDTFEKEIICSLINDYQYSEFVAFYTVQTYLDILRTLDADLHATEWAEHLDYAIQHGITKEIWTEQLQKIDKEIEDMNKS